MTPAYDTLLDQLAGHPDADTYRTVKDLPEMTLEQLAVVLQEYPQARLEALDTDAFSALVDVALRARSLEDLGAYLVVLYRDYVGSLVLRDVIERAATHRMLARLEALIAVMA